jgi:Fe-Mn family superoxide dismutase
MPVGRLRRSGRIGAVLPEPTEHRQFAASRHARMLCGSSFPAEFRSMPDVSRQTYPFTLPDLPYPYDALEPHLDQTTMRIHHAKHHKTYVDKLNEALAPEPGLHRLTLIELLSGLDKLPEPLRAPVRNNGGGHYNHDLFWNSLAPADAARAREPRGELARVLAESFGSFENFRTQFTQLAAKHFASGWVAMVYEHGAGKLALRDLKDHDVPPPGATTPLLIVDVWEHAYYVKFQNRRPEFLDAFWKVVDWDKTETRFTRSRTASRV